MRPFRGPVDLSTEDVAFGWDKGLGASPYADGDRAGTINAADDGRRGKRRKSRRQLVGQELKKPNAMAFFHIPRKCSVVSCYLILIRNPVPEAYSTPDRSRTGEPLTVGTTSLEGDSSPDSQCCSFLNACVC